MYVWTEEKNQINKRNHGFYFSEIVSIFDDPYMIDLYDAEHSSDEDRYLSIGYLDDGLIITVVNTDDLNGNTRLISARESTPKEARRYYENYKQRTNS
jgi:uncharacterized DUF497 family protein